MPSKTFQPLLFDLLTYKLPNTTYFDHYCKKKRRIYANGASAAARTASTANLSQKQKMALMMKRSRPFTSTNQLYEAYKANLAQFDPVSVQNNTASKAVKTAATNIKIQNILDDQSAAEASQAQTNFKAYILSPPPSPTNAKVNFADDLIASDEQLANLTQNVLQLDNNNDESKLLSQSQPHWMVYPEEKTPEYILDAKKRLNQIRQPNLVPSSSPSSSSKQHKVKISDEPVEIIGSDGKPMTDDEKRHWLSWPNPATPDKIREIRRRLGDDRYRKTAEMKSMLSKRPKTAYYSATIDATNQEEDNYIRPKTAVITTTTKNVAEPSNTKTVVTTEIVDPSSQFIVSYSPTMGNESALRQVSYEKLLEDSYVNSKSNYFDSNNNSFVNSSEFVNSGGMMCNYATVEDPLISASCQGKQTSDEMPLEAWINKANENDREAVLRILNRVNSGQSTMQRSRVKSGVVSSYSKPPLPPSQASIPQYDYTPTDRSNQYVRVKAVHSRPQHQPSTPLPVHLRSLIDVDTPATTNRKGASSRAKSSTGVRKLGVLRNNYQLRNDDETEKILLNHNLLTAQMIGPESVHYGYNV